MFYIFFNFVARYTCSKSSYDLVCLERMRIELLKAKYTTVVQLKLGFS